MKEKLTKAILDHTDEELRVIDLAGLVEAIEELYKPNVDYAALDPEKWGEIEYTNQVFPKGHWEVDDAGFHIWVDEE